jgi:gluconate 2-dehydrogenase gamma chain
MRNVSRRELFARAGAAGAAIIALPDLSRVLTFRRELFAQTAAQHTPAATQASTAGALTPQEKTTLAAVCARIIPTDEHGPGAAEAHAADYVDQGLVGALMTSRPEYTSGLAALDTAAHQRFGGAFARISPAQQDAVLMAAQDTPFFALVRGHTLQGTFCDPIYGGNANFVGWDLIGYPGVRLNVSAGEQNMSTPATRNHKSAYDYLMFSKAETLSGH